MKNLHNIEKSGFRRGEYVGYARGPWRITRSMDGWVMVPCSNCEYYGKISQNRSATLAILSEVLDHLS